MARASRPGRFVSSLLAIGAVVGLSLVSITPVQAATNVALGDLTAANPASNKYAGCVASVLTGSGVTFGSAAALSADLTAVWPSLPAGVTDTCKQAVDGNQPQVCVSPTDPATCPAIGAANAAAAADLAASFPTRWKVATDGVGLGGYAQAPLSLTGTSTATATAGGTFTTPVYVCTTKDCANWPSVGLFTDCGPTSCGPITTLTVSAIGRTPNGESGVQGHVHVVDGFGNTTTVPGFFGNGYWGTGCGATECVLSSPFTWICRDHLVLPTETPATANCGGQSLTVSFTFDSGAGGGCGCATAPAVGQLVEIQLSASALNYAKNPTVCAGILDCFRYDDSRLSYVDGTASPTAVLYPSTAPSAVIDLAASDLGCLVGVDVRTASAISCLDVNGAFAPLLQTAHAPVVPAVPPTITGSANPAGGWQRTPVTVSLTASADPTRTIQSITYSATGAQTVAQTVVAGSATQVAVSADGTTTLTFWATDSAGATSPSQSITVQVDRTAPAIVCATPSAAWSATDVTVACTASDTLSGLATPTQAQLSLATSVPAGTETAAAVTNSVTVCDVAGNCATAGPITGLKVDRLGPTITVTAPIGTYTVGQVVNAAYTCTDGGSGVATCSGLPANGSALDTSTAGSHSFTVDATDAVGNHTQKVGSYTVTAVVPTPTPTPTPSCKDEKVDSESTHPCDEHDAADRPVAEPKDAKDAKDTKGTTPTAAPKPTPTPKPKPTPTHKPDKHSGQLGDQIYF
jgi:hypothetical protein